MSGVPETATETEKTATEIGGALELATWTAEDAAGAGVGVVVMHYVL